MKLYENRCKGKEEEKVKVAEEMNKDRESEKKEDRDFLQIKKGIEKER